MNATTVMMIFVLLCLRWRLDASDASDASEVLEPLELEDEEEEEDSANSPLAERSRVRRFIHDSGGGDFGGGRDKACEMLVAVDEPLYAHLGRDIDNATTLIVDLVRRLNKIYHKAVLTGFGNLGRLYFRVKEVRVLFDFCTECNQTQHVYLSEFTEMDFSDFCLAHVFTYRDFPAGVQGLAWKGTVCANKYNTGFTTLLNHQVSATRDDSAMTLAHEIGHNLGAPHDEDAGCTSDFIMSESGSSHLRPRFSSCSIDAIRSNLSKVFTTPRLNCFVDLPMSEQDDFSVCGDGIVQGDEECDCGWSYKTCSDPCCYAAHISPSDLASNASAVPCRTNRKHVCLEPFASVWTFGFILPWNFILVVTLVAAVALTYDWRWGKRRLYMHVTAPKEMIRSETAEQMAKRLNRQEAVGKKVFVIQNPKMNPLISAPVPMRDPPEQPIIRGSAPRPPSLRPGSNRGSVGARRPLTRPPPPPPLPRPPRLQPPQPQLVPEQPKPGLVQQMKEKLERRA